MTCEKWMKESRSLINHGGSVMNLVVEVTRQPMDMGLVTDTTPEIQWP